MPLISKDTIKLALLPALQVADVDVAREVGRAAMTVLMAAAPEMRGGVVLEAVWRHDQGRDGPTTLSGPVVEIFCRCDRPTLEARYKARPRPTGYVPEHRDPSELWSGETLEPVALGWPVIEVDATHEVDRVALVSEIRRALDLSAS